jgi:hypothetical protein
MTTCAVGCKCAIIEKGVEMQHGLVDFAIKNKTLAQLSNRHNISELKQATFLSTRTSDCRGETELKIVFVSVCGNLQHI